MNQHLKKMYKGHQTLNSIIHANMTFDHLQNYQMNTEVHLENTQNSARTQVHSLV